MRKLLNSRWLHKRSAGTLILFILIFGYGGLYWLIQSHAAPVTTTVAPLATTTAPSADLNSDGIVDVRDLSILLAHWMQTGMNVVGDINGDGVVGPADLSILLDQYGNKITVSGMPSVSGATIIDTAGHPLVLRGTQIQSELNINWKDGSSVPNVLNQKVYNAILSWKMNALRLPIGAYNYQKANYMNVLDTVVSQATNAGLYVILGNFEDNQAGGGSSLLDQQGIQMWSFLAAHYKSNPRVMYDLINEPQYTTWPSLTSALQQGIDAIRAAGAKQIIVVQPGKAGGSQNVGWQTYTGNGFADPNIVYSKHVYEQVAAGNPTIWDQMWGPLLGKHPVYFGEWALLASPQYPVFCKGIDSTNADAVTNAFLNYLGSSKASWTAWSFTVNHLIQNESTLAPTNFQTGAPWTCPNGIGAGMGEVVKNYLASH